MAQTDAWALARIFGRLRAKGIPAEAIETANLISLIPDALRRLAFKFALMPPEEPRRQLLEEATTVALSAGVGDLTTLEDANFLPESINRGTIRHADNTYPLQEATDELGLMMPLPAFLIYFAIIGNAIKTRNDDGQLDTLTGDLSVTAIKIPTLATLKTQLETDFLDELEAVSLPVVTKK